MRGILLFEILGIVVIVLAGSALHFAHEWSGEAWPVAVVAAVNESVWEHLKLAFWPALAWSLPGWISIGRTVPNFWAGRLAALALPPVIIALGFYGYTAALGHHSLAADLILFVSAIAIGQLAAVSLYRRPAPGKGTAFVVTGLIFGLCLAFGSLTFVSPDIFLFREP